MTTTPASGRLRTLAALLATMLLAGGCATDLFGSRAVPPPPEQPVGEGEPYVIGVPDELEVRVWRHSDLSVSVPVRPDGKITVPLIDDVQAEGLTPEELKAVVTQQLSEFIAGADVTVIVREMRSKTVAVMGGVARSGLIPLSRNTRVLDVIAASGGFTTFARKSEVKILRNTDTGQVEYRFDYNRFIRGGDVASNILLVPGDTVVVPD